MSWAQEPEEQREYARRKVLRALRIYFAHKRWPRVAMSFILLATASVGVGSSWLMLRGGMDSMALRYPLAALAAYAVFLALVRVWVEIERRYFQADEDIEALLKGRDPKDALDRIEDRDWSALDWFDLSSVPDADEGCLVAVAVMVIGALLLAVGWAIISVLMAAPVLVAEVFLDAILVAALYKRMRGLDQRWWLAGALRQTAVPVLVTVIGLAVLGLIFAGIAPEAKSVGGVIKHFRDYKRS